MTTHYIYPAHLSRDGRLVIPVRATGHIEVDGRIVCEAAVPEPVKRQPYAQPGIAVCDECKAEVRPAPVTRVAARAQRRQAELDAWERLTGERPVRETVKHDATSFI